MSKLEGLRGMKEVKEGVFKAFPFPSPKSEVPYIPIEFSR